MDIFVDLLSAGAGWLLICYLTYLARKQKKRTVTTPPRVFRGIWWLSLSLSLYFTLRISPIAIGLDALFPWHNTARLLAYICVGWAAWFLNLLVHWIAKKDSPGKTRLLPIAMSLLLLICFPFTLALSPSKGDELPATFLDLCFRQVLYVYMIGLLTNSLILFRTLQSKERTALACLRLTFAQVSIMAAIALAIVKVTSSFIGYYTPGTADLIYLEYAGSLLKAVLVLPWLIIYLPMHMIVPLLYAWYRLRILYFLRDVRVVEAEVRRFCRPIATETPTRWQILSKPDYYASRSLIHILDARKQLSSNPVPEVIRLRRRLDGVDDTMGIPELLAFYAQVGRQMRKERRQQAAAPQEVVV